MADAHTLMKYLPPYDLDRIKYLALNNHVSFDEICTYYKINKNELKNLMRFLLNDHDYLNWKKIYKRSN